MQNYDDELQNFEEDFDPEFAQNYAGKMQPTRAVQGATFDLVMTNFSSENIKFELFSHLRSFTEQLKPNLVNSINFPLIPESSRQGLALSGLGVVSFNQKGDLIITNATTGAVGLSVACPQYGYRQLLKASNDKPFLLKAIRLTVTTNAQIDFEINHFRNTFVGGKTENPITPRTSFRPEQQQSLIVDVPLNTKIDGEHGFVYEVKANETAIWNCAIIR